MGAGKASQATVETLPVLPVSNPDNLLLPGNVRQFHVTEEPAVTALHQISSHANRMVLAHHEEGHSLAAGGLGCIVTVIQQFEFSGGSCMAIFGGEKRSRMHKLRRNPKNGLLLAECELLDDVEVPSANQAAAFRRILERQLYKLAQGSATNVSTEAVRNSQGITQLSAYVDYLALATVTGDADGLVATFLGEQSVEKRAKLMVAHLVKLHERHKIDRQIRRRVKQQMEKTHQEFHLSEQAKAIQEELDNGADSSLAELRQRIKEVGMSPVAEEKCLVEFRKLVKSPPTSPEASVLRSYIETLTNLPWQARSELNTDMHQAQRILDEDHHGLVKVKDRIMEYLAVQRRVGKPKGSVLCFVGPPGVGKTSLGQSIARATSREFVRVSLGGVHEEAAIRGHRKTYVASMPGRILKALAKAKVRNPVFMLDEFDKLVSGSGINGDPAAALLEVLDPEQNSTFTDQYVEVAFDLSEVLFITTANTVHHLPDALYDRLEMLRLPGYTDREKLAIAKRHLIPKQLAEHGLSKNGIHFSDAILTEIIRDYTHEAGVRNLERNIAKICRKIVTEQVVAKVAPAKRKPVTVKRNQVYGLLEIPEYYSTFKMPSTGRVGYVNGMIYGYGIFRMEAVTHEAKQESVDVTGITDGDKEISSLVSVATSLLQTRHQTMGLPSDFAKHKRVHIHLQDQALTPYGSLGLGLFVLLSSAFTRIPVHPGLALLGEINLRGDVISSESYSEYKATVMDAQRKKIKRIIVPQEDARLLAELPDELTASMEFVLVRTVWEALKHALVRAPIRLPASSLRKAKQETDVVSLQKPLRHKPAVSSRSKH